MKKIFFIKIIVSLVIAPHFLLAETLEKATFAGGCFWCMEPPFEKLEGVKSVISGFSGGKIKQPKYKDVAGGKTKHLEVVQITFDPSQVSYEKLLETFWVNINPTDSGGQFVDRGHQYSPAIFYHNENQKKLAEKSKALITEKKFFKKNIVTPIRQFDFFYPAGDEHQDYYKKNVFTIAKYKYYRSASGRDEFIASNWAGKTIGLTNPPKYVRPSDAKIKEMLTTLQYEVTQNDGTERPFDNKYWNNKEEGIYVDIVTGEPLFSSTDKYVSGTGWPSFTKPLVAAHVVEKDDYSLILKRVEVRSKYGKSHLGHVFDDGPKPTGKRYCINSAALRFVKKSDLQKNGLGEYLSLFPDNTKPKKAKKEKSS